MAINRNFLALLAAFSFVFCASVTWSYAATINAASASYSDVNDCITASTYGDTITVPSGSADWGANYVTITKNITLAGAGAGSTIITMQRGGEDSSIILDPDSTSISSGGVFEISGFTFDGNGTATTAIKPNNSSTSGFAVLKIHDNTFQDFGAAPCMVITGHWKGVVYENTWALDNDEHSFRYLGEQATTWNWLDEYTYGTDDVVFIEDNTFNVDWTCSSGGWASRIVIRFNTYNVSANLWPMVDVHGNQSSGVCAMMGLEMYENDISCSDSYTTRIAMRGGRVMHFKNELTTGTYGPRVQNENCNDLAGTCARDGDTQTFEIQNSYHFLNYDDGSISATSEQIEGCEEEITENSEYWNQNTSFNPGVDNSLTTGIGVGTKAQMDIVVTCTEGVGFWVTDEGEWNSTNAGPDGRLYRWDGDSWEVYYTPYTYPHPLRAPRSPSSLRIVEEK